MILKLSEDDVKVIEGYLEKLEEPSQEVLKDMLNSGQAYVKGDKIHIAAGYESRCLTFQFKEE